MVRALYVFVYGFFMIVQFLNELLVILIYITLYTENLLKKSKNHTNTVFFLPSNFDSF